MFRFKFLKDIYDDYIRRRIRREAGFRREKIGEILWRIWVNFSLIKIFHNNLGNSEPYKIFRFVSSGHHQPILAG